MEVENKIKIYEVEGQKAQQSGSGSPMITVKNHWNSPKFIVLKCDDGKSYTVVANEIIAAVTNAMNSVK